MSSVDDTTNRMISLADSTHVDDCDTAETLPSTGGDTNNNNNSSPSVMRQNATLSPKSKQGDNAGVSGHRFTREEMLRIRSQWDSGMHQDMRNSNPYSEGEWIYEDDGEQDASPGYISSYYNSFKSWMAKKREMRLRDELARQVEEQLRILSHEHGIATAGSFSTDHNHSEGEVHSMEHDGIDDNHPDRRKVKSIATKRTPSGDGVTVQLEVVDDPMEDITVSILPDNSHNMPPILSPSAMRQIAQKGLPPSLLFSKWKRLYSLVRDGDSFETMLRLVKNDHHSLLVIKSTRGEVFGGYADAVWEGQHSHEVGGVFYGTGRAVLFKVRVKEGGEGDDHDKDTETKKNNQQKKDDDDVVTVYKWTGVNRYIQLIDSHKKTMAMGGGGEEGSFGLCIEDDFRRGSTGHCETFNNEPLADQKQFDILDLEIWGFQSGQF